MGAEAVNGGGNTDLFTVGEHQAVDAHSRLLLLPGVKLLSDSAWGNVYGYSLREHGTL